MKKLFVCLCATVLLAGCGSGGSKEKVTKTCNISGNGMNVNFIIDGEGDTVTKGTLEMTASYEAMGITYEDAKAADADTLKEAQKLVLSEMDLTEDDGEVNTEVTEEGLKFTIAVPISELEQTFNATSMDDMVKTATESGYTCK